MTNKKFKFIDFWYKKFHLGVKLEQFFAAMVPLWTFFPPEGMTGLSVKQNPSLTKSE